MSTDKDELASLRKRVEELEAKAKPPEPKKEFKPEPYEPIDWTARMSMPPSAIRAMVEAVPDSVMRGVIGDRHAPTGRPGMIPDQPSDVRGREVPSSGTKGWVEPTPLRPPPGVAQADKLMDEQDRRDRAELARRLGKG